MNEFQLAGRVGDLWKILAVGEINYMNINHGHAYDYEYDFRGEVLWLLEYRIYNVWCRAWRISDEAGIKVGCQKYEVSCVDATE